MATEALDAERTIAARRPYFTAIRWSAVFAGTVVGVATYLLLALLGTAIGLSAVDPGAAEPVGRVPLWTGLWGLVSMIISAFIGGYVAGRMSGLGRRVDGLLHGFVAWGASTLFFTYLATTAVAGVLGGTIGALGQGVQAAAGQMGGGAADRLEQIITGTPGGTNISPDTLGALRERMQAQDREGAMAVLVERMGLSQERATTIVDQTLPLFGAQGEQGVARAAGQTVSTLTQASWWLFGTLILSLLLGMWGGSMGSRATSSRSAGYHPADERYFGA